jgi:hypothetical protein
VHSRINAPGIGHLSRETQFLQVFLTLPGHSYPRKENSRSRMIVTFALWEFIQSRIQNLFLPFFICIFFCHNTLSLKYTAFLKETRFLKRLCIFKLLDLSEGKMEVIKVLK